MLETTFPRIPFLLCFQVKCGPKVKCWNLRGEVRDVKRQTQRDLEVPVHSTLLISVPFPNCWLTHQGQPNQGQAHSGCFTENSQRQPQRDNNLSDVYTRLPTVCSVLASRYPCKLQLAHPDQSWLITLSCQFLFLHRYSSSPPPPVVYILILLF